MANTPSKRKTSGSRHDCETPSPSAASKQWQTPSSVASNAKFISPKKRRKIMKEKSVSHQPTEDKLTDTNAKKIFETNSTLLHVEINNSMWPFTSECYLEKDGDKSMIVFMRNQVNHNNVSQNLAKESQTISLVIQSQLIWLAKHMTKTWDMT